MPDVIDERECPSEEAAGRRSGCVRSREALAEACSPCPERDGVLRREHLCRCPVALGLRLLVRIERFGPEPSGLQSAERASLDFQERALARRLPPMRREAVGRSAEILAATPHACDASGCLHCRVVSVLRALDSGA